MTLSRREFLLGIPVVAALPMLRAPLRVAFVPPPGDSRPSALRGAAMAATEAERAASLFGSSFEMVIVKESALAKLEAVAAIVGGFDSAAALRLSRFAEARRLLFLNIGSEADMLRGEACSRHSFHVAPSDRMRTEVLRTAQPADGSEATVESWHGSLEAFGAAQLNDRFRARYSAPMDSDAWCAWFAVKTVTEASFRTKQTAPNDLLRYLERAESRFDGHKGRPLSFRQWDHQLRQPLYLVRGSSVTQLPTRGASGPAGIAQLDAFGAAEAEGACTWSAR